jgi:YD repeat-containing protein
MGAGPVNTAPTTVSASGQSYNWRFTQLVQRWLDGQDPNYGVFLKGDPEGTTNVFHFASNGDTSHMPQLLVTYEYAIGDRALYTYDRQSIDDRLGTAVNLGSGDLMLSANDLHIAGTGIDQYLGRFYNSLGSGLSTNGSGDFNYQWQMGTGNDVYFKFYSDGSAAYYGPSGYAVPFVRLANGSYASPTALDATLAKNADGTYTLTAHGDSVSQNFDANGRLTAIKDPNGNTISFAYTANPSLVAARPAETEARFDVLRGLPQSPALPRAMTPGCICVDSDFADAYSDAHAPADADETTTT